MRPSLNESKEKMVRLFVTASVFLMPASKARKMTSNTFWDFVRKPTNVGLAKDKDKEGKNRSAREQRIYDRLCINTDELGDYDEFDVEGGEDDDDLVSNSSSVFADDARTGVIVEDQDGPGEEDWERLNENEKDQKIGDALKQVGNIKKKKMSNIILLDMLGQDGKDTLKGIKQIRQKILSRDQLKIDNVYRAVTYFDQRMSLRRSILAENTKRSIEKTYVCREYSWKNEYDKIMQRKEQKRRMP